MATDSGQSVIPTASEQRVHPSWKTEDLESHCCEASVLRDPADYYVCQECHGHCWGCVAGADE